MIIGKSYRKNIYYRNIYYTLYNIIMVPGAGAAGELIMSLCCQLILYNRYR